MNSKQIGNIGEAKVLSKFIELGVPVYLPFGDNEKADMIIDFNKKLLKIQVKTSMKIRDGIMIFSLVSSTMHRKNGVKYRYTYNDIDFFACYNIEYDKIYLIDINKAPKTSISIRIDGIKVRQKKNLNVEEDFLIENVLNRLKVPI